MKLLHKLQQVGLTKRSPAVLLGRLPALVLSLFFFFFSVAISLGGTFVAFGPEDFVRGTGKPTPMTTNFTAADLHIVYMLRIDNGGQIGEFANVSSAVITLNGIDVVKPNEFNQNVTVIEKLITLLAENELVVELRSKPGSGIALQIIGIRPEVDITAPANLSVFGSSPITVSGTLGDGAVSVDVNGIAATVENETFTATVPLQEGNNTITAVARDVVENVTTASVQVTLDTTPPRVTIDSPPDGFVTNDASISVTGMINDIVVGTVNGDQAQVMVNGILAEVANRSFLAADVPLSPGSNTITAVGTDRAGNTATTSITVTFEEIMAQPQIRKVSGNTQTGPIGSQLPQPLVAALTDEAGNPVSDKTILFQVMENNGSLSEGSNSGRFLGVKTNVQGQAEVLWTLGTRAGAGNNIVEATASGFTSKAIFTATALPAAPDKINMDAGNNQVGVTDQPLPSPFAAVVTDAGNNRLGDVPVTFTVIEGEGNFNGQSTITVNTDSDGRALAILTLGSEEGFDNNVVEATFPGNAGLPATFVASGKVAGDPAETQVSGVVLDNSNNPVPGVTMQIEGTSLVTQTDDQGQFVLEPAPVGHVELIADGSTAQRPGVWPSLEFELVTVAGQNNTIGMPIFLLPLDIPNQLCVDESTGGTLTLPQMPGFALEVLPGSATFPDGSKQGCISVTPVHADKIPMTPNFGQQPRLIVTIQPSGVLFDPPAPLTLPNVDGLAPGEVTELYSFDHDLGQFVSIGTGSVSADGTVITSDPGVGIIKGGWHCGGNPSPTGGAQTASVSVFPMKVGVAVGKTAPVTATGSPLPSGTPAYLWATQDSNIATVAIAQGNNSQTHPNNALITGVAPGTTKITVTYKCASGAPASADIEVFVGEIAGGLIVSVIKPLITVPPSRPQGIEDRLYPLVPSFLISDLQIVVDFLLSVPGSWGSELLSKINFILKLVPGGVTISGTPGFTLTKNGKPVMTNEDREWLIKILISFSTNPSPPSMFSLQDFPYDKGKHRMVNEHQFVYDAGSSQFLEYTPLRSQSEVGFTPFDLPFGTFFVFVKGGTIPVPTPVLVLWPGFPPLPSLKDNKQVGPKDILGGVGVDFIEKPLYTRAGPQLRVYEDTAISFRAPAFFSELRFEVNGTQLDFKPVLGHSLSPTLFTWPSHYVYKWEDMAQKYILSSTLLQTGSRGPLPNFFSLGVVAGDPPFGPQPSQTNKCCSAVTSLTCTPICTP